MICFEVRVNGELACTAGAGDTGVLSAILTWVRRRAEGCPDDESEAEWCQEDLDLSVGGIAHQDGRSEHVHWLRRGIKPGDEVTIRVVQRDACDPPAARLEYPARGRNTFEEPDEAAVAHRSRHADPGSGMAYEVRLSEVLQGADRFDDAVGVELAFEDGSRHVGTFFRDDGKGEGPRGCFYHEGDEMILVADLTPELMVEAATALVARGDLGRAFRPVAASKG